MQPIDLFSHENTTFLNFLVTLLIWWQYVVLFCNCYLFACVLYDLCHVGQEIYCVKKTDLITDYVCLRFFIIVSMTILGITQQATVFFCSKSVWAISHDLNTTSNPCSGSLLFLLSLFSDIICNFFPDIIWDFSQFWFLVDFCLFFIIV